MVLGRIFTSNEDFVRKALGILEWRREECWQWTLIRLMMKTFVKFSSRALSDTVTLAITPWWGNFCCPWFTYQKTKKQRGKSFAQGHISFEPGCSLRLPGSGAYKLTHCARLAPRLSRGLPLLMLMLAFCSPVPLPTSCSTFLLLSLQWRVEEKNKKGEDIAHFIDHEGRRRLKQAFP